MIDSKNKAKIEDYKVEIKDHTINMEGECLETKARKLSYGVVAPRLVEHPTLAKNVGVKPYSKVIWSTQF